ncbi:hypothetical protein TYRP_002670 [Tyrophagus putrescentiae]|nr:hypothetical protein TYRP_002670 [Tyrophagus putrescentiae]
MKNRDYVNYRMNLPNPDPSKRGFWGRRFNPISDVFYSLKNGVRLYRAQEQFKRELDEEEKLEINKKG